MTLCDYPATDCTDELDTGRILKVFYSPRRHEGHEEIKLRVFVVKFLNLLCCALNNYGGGYDIGTYYRSLQRSRF